MQNVRCPVSFSGYSHHHYGMLNLALSIHIQYECWMQQRTELQGWKREILQSGESQRVFEVMWKSGEFWHFFGFGIFQARVVPALAVVGTCHCCCVQRWRWSASLHSWSFVTVRWNVEKRCSRTWWRRIREGPTSGLCTSMSVSSSETSTKQGFTVVCWHYVLNNSKTRFWCCWTSCHYVLSLTPQVCQIK